MRKIHLKSVSNIRPTVCNRSGVTTTDLDEVTCEKCAKIAEQNGHEWREKYEAWASGEEWS